MQVSGESLAEAVKRLRQERGIAVAVLARRSGVSRSRLHAIEAGTAEKPYSKTLAKLSTGLASRTKGVLDLDDQAALFHVLEAAAGYVALSSKPSPATELVVPETSTDTLDRLASVLKRRPALAQKALQIFLGYDRADSVNRQWMEQLLNVLVEQSPSSLVFDLAHAPTQVQVRQQWKPVIGVVPPVLTEPGRGRNAPIPTVVWRWMAGNDLNPLLRACDTIGIPRDQLLLILYKEAIPESSILRKLAIALTAQQPGEYNPDPLRAEEIYAELAKAKERQEQNPPWKPTASPDKPSQHQEGAAS